MPSLAQTLPANDLGFLRIAASLWGIELASSAPAEAATELSESMLDAELMEEVIAALPDPARDALQSLFDAGGRLPWAQFARRFGDIREMGPGRRDREQPHARPNSAAETLYYRALIGKAFFDTPSGSQEFAFLPDDLMQALEFIGFEPGEAPAPEPEEPASPPAKTPAPEPEYADLTEPEYADLEETIPGDEPESVVLPTVSARKPPVIRLPVSPAFAELRENEEMKGSGRAATPAEKAHAWPANDHILDDLTTLLAALRLGIEAPALAVPAPVLTGLLAASRLIIPSSSGQGARGEGLQPEAVKTFLEAPREAALASLVDAWQSSETFNELRLLPGLAFEGAWDNQPLVTREFILNLLEPIPEGAWWSIPSFIRDIKQKYPDFQRPAGDYDAWFIKRLSDGQYLRGFAHWDEVDGALIRYFFQVMRWLGQLDLAAPDETAAPTAFRIVNNESRITSHETSKITISSNGLIVIPRLAPRSVRYQVARFCQWESEGRVAARSRYSPAELPDHQRRIETHPDSYRYLVTPASLKRAAGQGLKASHLLGLLAKHAGGQIPPVFAKALQRWESNGTEARIETLTVLKVSKPETLNELRASKAARFLGEIIGPTTVVIQRGSEAKVAAALAELGLLADVESGGDTL